MTPECEALLTAADDKLRAAELLRDSGLNGDAASRAYYAAFHAISALHLAAGNTFSSHAQLIGRFNKDYVRTGIFVPSLTRILTRLFEDRQLGDYEPISTVTSEQAQQDIADAHEIIKAVRTHISQST
ncbi:DNA-binding protein [Thiocapsa imhoffii]|uniref:DNA-binding protein n=1 Tax=Thiocapsa imhoffii TaxID=382777 RepID=A0A9X0WL88_9GAMM|nr:HEPN domain-containing protein [Thiocapsa imhoffii]MBK1646816.1 DNA-binding protein [Thiocapsa imhoffii]